MTLLTSLLPIRLFRWLSVEEKRGPVFFCFACMYTVYLRLGYMHAVIANVIRTSSSSVGKLAFSRRRQMLVPVDLLCAADISAVCWARLLFCLMPGTRRRQNRIRQIRQSRPNVQRFVASSFFWRRSM